jgi:uncharacterized phage-associated protein
VIQSQFTKFYTIGDKIYTLNYFSGNAMKDDPRGDGFIGVQQMGAALQKTDSYENLQIESEPYSPGAIVNWFLRRAFHDNKPFTHLKLQKLLFFAHAGFLARYDRLLIDEPAEAWQYGPVFSSVYHEYKRFGSHTIPVYPPEFMKELDFSGERTVLREYNVQRDDEQVNVFLQQIWEKYSSWDATKLSEKSHEKGSPWDTTKASDPRLKKMDISHKEIKEYYSQNPVL